MTEQALVATDIAHVDPKGLRERWRSLFLSSEALRRCSLLSPVLLAFIYFQLRFSHKPPDVIAMGSLILLLSFFSITFSEWIRRRGKAGTSGSGL